MPKIKSYDQQNQEIKRLFKIALIDKGWNQGHLAKICGFTESQISRIINRPDRCKFVSVQRVAKKLGIKSLPIF